MKRFFVVAAALGLLAGVGAQAWADCTIGTNGTTACCRWTSDNCWGIGGTYDDMKTPADCEKNYGDVVTSCSGKKDEYCNYGQCVNGDGWNCESGGCFAITGASPCGTGGEVVDACPAGTLPPAAGGSGGGTGGGGTGGGGTGGGGGGGSTPECGGYCKWEKCEGINPDPTGEWGTVIPDCAAAKENCLKNSTSHSIYSDAACTNVSETGAVKFCDAYCKWDGACEAVNTDPTGEWGTIIAECSDAIANCVSYSDAKQTFSSKSACEAYVSVKHFGSKAPSPALRVSYAKGRVSVNWTPSAKISKGTVQLINAKGVALSTAFIKANSGKVSVKLGTVGVPTGMYFIHIDAVGQNGKRIAARSTISIVK